MIRQLAEKAGKLAMAVGECAVIHLAPDFDPESNVELPFDPTYTTRRDFRRDWDYCFDDGDNSDDAADVFDEVCYECRHAFLAVVHEHGALLIAVDAHQMEEA